jgi:hypothetical protein
MSTSISLSFFTLIFGEIGEDQLFLHQGPANEHGLGIQTDSGMSSGSETGRELEHERE